MGIVERLLGGKKSGKKSAAPAPERPAFREGVPLGLNQEEPVLTITEEAKQKIRSILESQEPPARTIRVSASAPGKFAMNLEPEGKPGLDDTVLPYEGFEIYLDPTSVRFAEGATLNWIDSYGGGGFQFTSPQPQRPARREIPEGPEGDAIREMKRILDEKVNPAVASHGGYIDLIDYKDGVAYIEMSGGCQGCAMSKMTLKQGVEETLRRHFPDLEEVLDVTDHAGGRNPYYAGV